LIKFPRPPGARILKDTVKGKRSSSSNNGYVKSADGTRIFYSVEGQGRPLVFCYGLVCSSLHWTYQIDYFKHHYQTIWFDYRGHQNSDFPKDLSSLTVENMAKDLDAVLVELGISKATLLGHSMGVNVVLEYLRQKPQMIEAMVLANGTAQRPLETLFGNNALQSVFRLLKKAYDFSPKLVTKMCQAQRKNPLAKTLIALGGFNPHLTPAEDIELYVDQVLALDPVILLHLIENYDHYDATAWLGTVTVPTLILAGQQDKVIPLPQQELMHQLIPNSTLEVIQHGSHCPQMDLPELVNLKIEQFLRTQLP
jgi:pimeloyl-ACP methyl ester carboxylesterase